MKTVRNYSIMQFQNIEHKKLQRIRNQNGTGHLRDRGMLSKFPVETTSTMTCEGVIKDICRLKKRNLKIILPAILWHTVLSKNGHSTISGPMCSPRGVPR